jgi:putative addiction module component (TIGR02574 family)
MKTEHAALLNLSPAERLLLVQDLWDSLEAEDIPLTDEQMTELDRRNTAYEANPDRVALGKRCNDELLSVMARVELE